MEFARQLSAILFVFGLLWAGLWFVRKRGFIAPRRKSGSKLLQSCGRLALTPRHSIHLIRIRDRTIAVGVHPEGLTLLCEVESCIGESHQDQSA